MAKYRMSLAQKGPCVSSKLLLDLKSSTMVQMKGIDAQIRLCVVAVFCLRWWEMFEENVLFT